MKTNGIPKIITGRLFNIYFESLYDNTKPSETHLRTVSCIVIAKDATEAMEKAIRAFPKERVSSLHCGRDSYPGNDPRQDKIVL